MPELLRGLQGAAITEAEAESRVAPAGRDRRQSSSG